MELKKNNSDNSIKTHLPNLSVTMHNNLKKLHNNGLQKEGENPPNIAIYLLTLIHTLLPFTPVITD